MLKNLIVQCLLVLSFTVQSFAANWYLSTSASGNGSGSSWANADDWATFNHAGLNPGDVVYVDGGASDSLLYTGLTFNTAASGSAGNPIIYRRSSDAGHNGIPVFYTTASGDTTFGEFSIPVSTGTQYVKCGVVATQTDQPETIVGAAIMYMDAIKIDSTSQRP